MELFSTNSSDYMHTRIIDYVFSTAVIVILFLIGKGMIDGFEFVTSLTPDQMMSFASDVIDKAPNFFNNLWNDILYPLIMIIWEFIKIVGMVIGMAIMFVITMIFEFINWIIDLF